MHDGWIVPDWPAPACVRSLLTSRHGGVSQGVFASLNLGSHVGDDPLAVAANRALVARDLPAAPFWLDQVHGALVLEAGEAHRTSPEADASVTRKRGTVCAVLTADCLPVLLCGKSGEVVAAAHAGWRGLHAGVLENTVRAMSCPAARILAYFGPAIGPRAFEVGDEVRNAFVDAESEAGLAFNPAGPGKWLADLYLLARQRLQRLGVDAIYGGEYCTVRETERFFSYRRDGKTGRMASMIWLTDD